MMKISVAAANGRVANKVITEADNICCKSLTDVRRRVTGQVYRLPAVAGSLLPVMGRAKEKTKLCRFQLSLR